MRWIKVIIIGVIIFSGCSLSPDGRDVSMDKKTVIFPASGGEAYVHSAEADGLIPAGTLSVMFFDKEEGVSKELSVSISGASSDLVCELGWIKVILKDAADKHPDRVEISVRPNDTK